MFRVRVCLLMLIVAILTCTTDAQDSDCLHRFLPLTVRESHGFVVHGLVPSDFVAESRRLPVKIISIKPDARPHRIVILLQTSGIMIGAMDGREWNVVIGVAAQLAESRLPNTSLALIVFSDKVQEQIDFSQGNSAVESRLLQIQNDPNYVREHVRGRTAFRDAVVAALKLLGGSKFSDSIYVIGRGFDSASHTSFEKVHELLIARGVRLHCVSFLPELPLGRQAMQLNPTDAELLQIDSGGLYFGPLGRVIPASPDRVESVTYDYSKEELRILSIALSQFYLGITNNDLMEIELPQAKDKPMKWTFAFSAAAKKTHRDLSITYPRILAPCGELSH